MQRSCVENIRYSIKCGYGMLRHMARVLVGEQSRINSPASQLLGAVVARSRGKHRHSASLPREFCGLRALSMLITCSTGGLLLDHEYNAPTLGSHGSHGNVEGNDE
jgi:hypothetical protein